jgi:flagellum-specific ATP synthase
MSIWTAARDTALLRALGDRRSRIAGSRTVVVEGVLKRVVGLTLEATGCHVQIGGRCRIFGENGVAVEAEVVGFSGERTYLMSTGDMDGLRPNARVVPMRAAPVIGVGPALLGRVLDGEGRPLDGRGRC